MQNFKIYKTLFSLNELPKTEAETMFLSCCGSAEWARKMSEALPFRMLGDLFETADKLWTSLSLAGQREAFAAEKSGVRKPLRSFIEKDERDQFDELNSLYESKFGFIFIVNTSGKTSSEILTICRVRLGNSIETELRLASHELRGIIEARLSGLIEK